MNRENTHCAGESLYKRALVRIGNEEMRQNSVRTWPAGVTARATTSDYEACGAGQAATGDPTCYLCGTSCHLLGFPHAAEHCVTAQMNKLDAYGQHTREKGKVSKDIYTHSRYGLHSSLCINSEIHVCTQYPPLRRA